jgi:hypothetical protein
MNAAFDGVQFSLVLVIMSPSEIKLKFHRDITSNFIVFKWVILRVSLSLNGVPFFVMGS